MITDQYLTEQGYTPCVMRDGKLVPVSETTGLTIYSTMSVLCLFWMDDKGEHVATTGLNEVGHPPTLIGPRPQIKAQTTKEGDTVTVTMSVCRDAHMDRLIAKYGIAEVFARSTAGWNIELNEVE